MKLITVIFMGGRASRLGGVDKADITVGGRRCEDRVLSALRPHCHRLAKSVANSASQIKNENFIYDLPSSPDLDGISNALRSVMRWGLKSTCDGLVTCTVDTPFLPMHFVPSLRETYETSVQPRAPIVSYSGGRRHGLHALWPRACFTTVIAHIEEDGLRSINQLHEKLGSLPITFDATPCDPFLNINTPEDLRHANEIARTN